MDYFDIHSDVYLMTEHIFQNLYSFRERYARLIDVTPSVVKSFEDTEMLRIARKAAMKEDFSFDSNLLSKLIQQEITQSVDTFNQAKDKII